MHKLKKQEIVNEITLKAFQETDIQELGLNIGQLAVLRFTVGYLRKDSHPALVLRTAAASQSQPPQTMSLAMLFALLKARLRI